MNDKEKQLLTTRVGVKGNVRAITITDNVPDHWPSLLNVVRAMYEFYAYIYHDKDVDDDGKLIDKHIHILAVEKGGTTLKSHCERFSGIVPANFVCKVKNPRAMAKYLIHKGYDDKYRYAVTEVKTNNFARYQGMISDGSRDVKELWSDYQKVRAGQLSVLDYLELYRTEFESMPFYQKNALMERLMKNCPNPSYRTMPDLPPGIGLGSSSWDCD